MLFDYIARKDTSADECKASEQDELLLRPEQEAEWEEAWEKEWEAAQMENGSLSWMPG